MLKKYLTIYRHLILAIAALILLVVVATFGYWLISGREYSLFDAFYMTFITIATIGYGEIIDLSKNPAGRILTVVIALIGIGILTYILTNVTALFVEGQITDSLRRRRMENKAQKSKGHYIICGVGNVGRHIVRELYVTKRPVVLIDSNLASLKTVIEDYPDVIYIEGDATDNSVLLKAGIEKASGIFTTINDDNQNLVISLSAKQLNHTVRVVARCTDIKNVDKLKRAGADAVIAPNHIGGLRMASEMVRPTAVSFLDTMLRDATGQLRVEEIHVPGAVIGKEVTNLNLKRFRSILLLAIKSEGRWIYNPPENYMFKSNDTLILMTTPEERCNLEEIWDV